MNQKLDDLRSCIDGKLLWEQEKDFILQENKRLLHELEIERESSAKLISEIQIISNSKISLENEINDIIKEKTLLKTRIQLLENKLNKGHIPDREALIKRHKGYVQKLLQVISKQKRIIDHLEAKPRKVEDANIFNTYEDPKASTWQPLDQSDNGTQIHKSLSFSRRSNRQRKSRILIKFKSAMDRFEDKLSLMQKSLDKR